MRKIIIIFMLMAPLSLPALAQDDWTEAIMVDSPNWQNYIGLEGLTNPRLSPDGRVLFFNHNALNHESNTAYTFYSQGDWQVPFDFPYRADDIFLYAEQDTILYYSARQEQGYFNDIWSSRLQDGQWQPAVNLGPIINSEGDEHYPSISQNGERFCFSRDGVIMYSDIIEGEFTEPVEFPDYINTDQYEDYPVIYIDGRRLYFNRHSDPFGYNRNLIYVSYFEDGVWQEPQPISSNINFYLYHDELYGFSYGPSFAWGGYLMYFGHTEFALNGEMMNSIWYSEIPMSVNDENAELPDKVDVTAYPNPFNSSTRIAITGDTRRISEVAIYDITGGLVCRMPVGSAITWDGKTSDGKDAASGLYFIKVTGDNFLEVEKLTLLR